MERGGQKEKQKRRKEFSDIRKKQPLNTHKEQRPLLKKISTIFNLKSNELEGF